ncbi:MAG: sigma-54-dependent Fis family transcriptional regulator, partial [Spirochaetales bacterium]|nr:sigma-54-dependent Fis family transcriptional regulator [Spirochaetales bacterium]
MKKNDYSVLIIDDEEGLREGLAKVLEIEGFSVRTASTAEEAVRKLGEETYSLVFIDYKLPDKNGIEILKAIDSNETKSVMITAYATVGNAVEAMKAGATDYLMKPFSNQDIVDITNKFYRSVGTKKLQTEDFGKNDDFIFRSPAMKLVMNTLRKVASSTIPILILGESGTGKEKVARCISSSGCYAGKPFVGINCAAIPSELLESELFGYEKGAFSGAA